ncbi:hypothetical protein CMK11_07750 [Candidatus Poribacteria bacterium]|nr:hypothetical protein [Candidatus Poribacteria bacterium]
MSGARGRGVRTHSHRAKAATTFARPPPAASRRALWTGLLVAVVSATASAGPLHQRQAPSEPARRVAHVGIGRVQALAFSPVGGRLAVATTGALELWNTETWEREAVLPVDEGKPFPRSLSLSFSGNGAVLAVGSSGYPRGGIALWSMTSLTVVATLNDSPRRTGGVGAVNLSADGSVLAAYTHGGKVELWDIQSMALLRIVDGGPDINLSPDGSLLTMAGQGGVTRVWDVATGTAFARIEGQAGGTAGTPVEFSPDGTMLAAVHGWDGQVWVRLWELPSHRKVGTLEDEGHHIETLAFSADGARLAAAGGDEVVRLWDVRSSRLVARFRGRQDRINSLSFSADGSMLASGGGGVVLVWDVATGRVRRPPRSDRP